MVFGLDDITFALVAPGLLAKGYEAFVGRRKRRQDAAYEHAQLSNEYRRLTTSTSRDASNLTSLMRMQSGAGGVRFTEQPYMSAVLKTSLSALKTRFGVK